MRILFIGDVFGSPGRKIIRRNLEEIKKKYSIDLVIANVENAAHGKGITPRLFHKFISAGVDFMTLGNHSWSKVEVVDVLTNNENIIRPYNLHPDFPYYSLGVGTKEFIFQDRVTVRVTNLLGSTVGFKGMQTNPFIAMEEVLADFSKPDIHIVDFHAETTSEKYAFLWAFDGRVDVIVGTHTHVPTNDACITKNNTAFICDVGMTGPSMGIIGGKKEEIIKRFYDPTLKFRLDVQDGPAQLCAVIIDYDEDLRKVISIDSIVIREGFEYACNVIEGV